MTPTQIPTPPKGFAAEAIYRIKPREKRSFHSVLDAKKLVAENPPHETAVRIAEEDGLIVLTMDHTLIFGKMREVVRCEKTSGGLVAKSFARTVEDASGAVIRHEEVADFGHDRMGFPAAMYPEIALPFMLGWLLTEGGERSLYAWINDRFVAKLYVEVVGKAKLPVGGKEREVVECVMYPDLNDWVPLGRVLSAMAKPFIPKYRIWFSKEAPYRLVKFEGPYGPPGAPELVLDLHKEPE